MERLICIAIGYVCGLFQTGLHSGKSISHRYPQAAEAEMLGSTNVMRTLGKKAGALNLLCDCLKCIIAIAVVRMIFRERIMRIFCPCSSLYAAAGCILGHNFPFYLNFKGGKGVAASVGLVIAFDWRIFVICAIVFFGLFFLTHYVSLCSISAYFTALVSMIIFGQMGSYHMAYSYMMELYILMALLTVLAFYRHKNNIQRLLNGTENKIYLGKSKNK